jgi:hypothetical protein
MASNFNDTVPAAPAGNTNVAWQTDGSGNDSAYVPTPFLTVSNVSIISLIPGDVIVWNGSQWVNALPPGATLETNGTLNGSQTLLNLVAGSNITLTDNGSGSVTIASPSPTVNIQTASYTAVLGDANNIVEMNVAGANNFTVPTNASVAFPIGTALTVIQFGAGQTTLVAAGGVTINTPSSLTTRAQYSTVSVIKIATNAWVAAGDLT